MAAPLELLMISPFEADPVIEAFKRDVDRTLIRENLKLSPEQRLQKMISVAQVHAELRRAAKEAWRK